MAVILAVVNRTFWEFSYEESEYNVSRRANSEPPSRGTIHETPVSATAFFRVAPSHPMQPPSSAKSNIHIGEEHGRALPHPQKKYFRPSKQQRDKFHKFVNQLKAQIDDDVDSFDISKVRFPQHVIHDETSRKKVASILETYAKTKQAPSSSCKDQHWLNAGTGTQQPLTTRTQQRLKKRTRPTKDKRLALSRVVDSLKAQVASVANFDVKQMVQDSNLFQDERSRNKVKRILLKHQASLSALD